MYTEAAVFASSSKGKGFKNETKKKKKKTKAADGILFIFFLREFYNFKALF